MENRIIISPELAFSINFGIVKMTFLQIRRVIHRHSRKEIGSSMRRIICHHLRFTSPRRKLAEARSGYKTLVEKPLTLILQKQL